MTDPWMQAAKRLNVQRAETELARAQAAALNPPRPPRRDPMEIAIEETTPVFRQFIRERGAAAQALLAARGQGEYVLFGADKSIGYYKGIYFTQLGIREGEQPNTYKIRKGEDGAGPSDAARAVQFFAWFGGGYNDPDKVRNIVAWFQAQMDKLAREL